MWGLIIYSVVITFLFIHCRKNRQNVLFLEEVGTETTVEIVTIDIIKTAQDKNALSLMIFEDEFTKFRYAIIDDMGLNSKYRLFKGDRFLVEIIDNAENPQLQAISIFIEGHYCTALQILEGSK